MYNNKYNNQACTNQNGFTLFEIIVVVLLVGVLMSAAIDRMLRIQVDAERVSVQHMIGTINSAVNLQAAELVLKQGLNAIKSLENTNPIRYLSDVPYTYVGEKNDTDISELKTASWYYDTHDKILGYKVRNDKYFVSDVTGVPRIRLKIALVYGEGSNGRKNRIQGINVTSLDEYFWKL